MEIAQLRKIPLFAGLTNDHLARIARVGSERRFEAGSHLFREGDAGHEFFVILSGRVRISKTIEGIGEEALAILDPGDYFGEMALVDDTPRSADAIAHTGCTLWAVQKADLDQLMFVDKDLAYEILWTFVRTLSARLRETNDKIKTFFVLSARF